MATWSESKTTTGGRRLAMLSLGNLRMLARGSAGKSRLLRFFPRVPSPLPLGVGCLAAARSARAGLTGVRDRGASGPGSGPAGALVEPVVLGAVGGHDTVTPSLPHPGP